MDETKNLSGTDGLQSVIEGSGGSSDETKGFSETGGSQSLTGGSRGAPNGEPSRIGRYRIIHRLGACLRFAVYALLANDQSVQAWAIGAQCSFDPIPMA